MSQIFTAIILITLGILTRTVFHIGPNFEFVTAISLIAGYMFTSKKIAMAVPFTIMFVSDSIIGNTNIFLFTWSAYLLMPFIGGVLKRFKTNNRLKKIMALEGTGILSVLMFYFWTNAGVVITTNMYSKDLVGLVTSYINALPFLKPQLLGVLLTVPIIYILVILAQKLVFKREFDIHTGIKKLLV